MLINEVIDISKDFLIKKILSLITKVLSELRKQNIRILSLSSDSQESHLLRVTLLEQIKWTMFMITDKETQRRLSPAMSLEIVSNLTNILRGFNPLPYDFISSFIPGLSSIATKVISNEVKSTLKVKV